MFRQVLFQASLESQCVRICVEQRFAERRLRGLGAVWICGNEETDKPARSGDMSVGL